MNSVSEKIKNECLDGMDFERILEIYNLYIDVNQPCDFHKLASSPIAASVSWNGKFLTAKLLRETAERVIDTLLDPEFYKHLDDTSDVFAYNVGHGVAQWLLEHPNQNWNNNYLIYLYADLDKWRVRLDLTNKDYSIFREPDLNNQLTAIALQDDGRMFKKLKLVGNY